MKQKKKGKFSTIILIIMLLAGLSLLLYPTVSDYWNSFHQSQAISNYSKIVDEVDSTEYDRILEEARAFNAILAERGIQWIMSDELKEEYYRILDITGTGIMGYIEIPKISGTFAVYHGTGEEVLQVAIGHIEGSSFPVGGESTHCIVSGHRGLPSAKLFTDLDKMEIGDLFMLHVMDETFTYSVDQIVTVLPDDLSSLEIEVGQDLCTLVTCTPYGVNTHRLLVRGHRVDNIEEPSTIRVIAEAIQIDPILVAPIVAIPILLLLLIILLISTRKKKEKKEQKKEKVVMQNDSVSKN